MDESKDQHEFVFAKRPVQWVILIVISFVILVMMHSRQVSLPVGPEDTSTVVSNLLESNLNVGERRWLVEVNLNSANERELALLTGVGPVLASRIVADRSARGTFASVDDLQRVHGIGPRKIADIRGMAIVTE
ncbi:MAG: helix-hairpin-helix domain-containing protein [Rubripirellula sp.]|nr:helix-hairpin-helix domain-containing protein [Rubripirellula sp.]